MHGLQTKEQLLREAKKMFDRMTDGKTVNHADMLAWLVAYDVIKEGL